MTKRKGEGGKRKIKGWWGVGAKFHSHERTEELRESWKEKRYREGRVDGWMDGERGDVLGLKMVPVGSRWKRELICLHGPAFLSAR